MSQIKMSQVILCRSIPLSKDTRDAWRDAGVRLVRRSSLNSRAIRAIVERLDEPRILNLGNLDIDFSGIKCDIYNRPDTIRAISHPVSLRHTLGDFIPEQTRNGPHWHKEGGFGGRGATFHEKLLGECVAFGGDVQAHVNGVEYRVITVGNVVVQASKKVNVEWVNGKHNFDYEWCGVDGIRSNGIIPYLKSAIEAVPGGSMAVLGWDIIVADRCYIIECNTSPGVNEPTAKRIVSQMEKTK